MTDRLGKKYDSDLYKIQLISELLMKMILASRTISHMMIKSSFEILSFGIYSAHHDDDDCDDGNGGSDGEV